MINSVHGIQSGMDRGSSLRADSALTTPFKELLERPAGAGPTAEDRKSAREAATSFVASAFVVPVLAAMRESPLAPQTGPFAVNTAEKRFGPLLDERLADAITKAANFPLIDTIVDRYLRVSPDEGVMKESFDARA